MSTCNRLDLQALGSQPVMPKNLPNHCTKPINLHNDEAVIIHPAKQGLHFQLALHDCCD